MLLQKKGRMRFRPLKNFIKKMCLWTWCNIRDDTKRNITVSTHISCFFANPFIVFIPFSWAKETLAK